MKNETMKNLSRWLPPLSSRNLGWFGGIVSVFFYLYLLVVLVRVGALWGASSTAEHLAVLAGLSVLYLAGVSARWIENRPVAERLRSCIARMQRDRVAVVGASLLVAFLCVAVLAPLLAPYDPVAQSNPALERYRSPSVEHPMGTDKFGRDVLSRVIYGSRISLAVGFLAVVLAAVFGMFVGAFSGYLGGRWDEAVMRVVDGLLSFPRLLLALTLTAFFVNSFWLVVVVLAATGWMGVARLVRARVLSLKERDFVQAAVATGAGRTRIVVRHLVPGILGTVVVAATLRVGTIILLESYLSFLGLGVQPPVASWGSMVLDGRDVLLSAWWVSAFPGLAIVVAVVACNLLGDGLRDALDPRGGR